MQWLIWALARRFCFQGTYLDVPNLIDGVSRQPGKRKVINAPALKVLALLLLAGHSIGSLGC